MKKIIVALLFCFGTVMSAQDRKPNILMIAVDDLNDWVGVFGGNPQVKTPNIDKLAKKGMIFHNTSCPGPVCGPSRSGFLSGFMPETTGVYGNAQNMLNSEIVKTHATLPEYFSKNGYLTISSGKIFHPHYSANGADYGQWAWDVWEQEKGKWDINPERYFSRDKGIINGKKIENPLYAKGGGAEFSFGPTLNSKETTMDYMTAKWFENKLKDKYEKPFFMAVGISRPHLPFFVPQEYFDMYDLDKIKIPEYKMDDLDDILDKNGNKVHVAEPDFLWAKHYGIEKELARAYMASVTYADECIGVVLDALEKSNYADNTIIILYGDHGWHLGEKLRYRKATLWKESTQLPFVMFVPGMKGKQDCFRNVNLMDLYPTLIDLCKLPKKELDGKSIAPLLKNPKLEWSPAITTTGKGEHSVMTEEWHYIEGRKGTIELYNIKNDPMEWDNLANKNTPEIEAMKKKLKAFIPAKSADAVANDTFNEGDYGKSGAKKIPDMTIKATRDLSKLK